MPQKTFNLSLAIVLSEIPGPSHILVNKVSKIERAHFLKAQSRERVPEEMHYSRFVEVLFFQRALA
ncbi:hypothetical protein CCP2SC5_370012 [Azospirillaceae bacterium]